MPFMHHGTISCVYINIPTLRNTIPATSSPATTPALPMKALPQLWLHPLCLSISSTMGQQSEHPPHHINIPTLLNTLDSFSYSQTLLYRTSL